MSYGYVISIGDNSEQDDYFKTLAGAKRAAKKFLQTKIADGFGEADSSLMIYNDEKAASVKFWSDMEGHEATELSLNGTAEEVLNQLNA